MFTALKIRNLRNAEFIEFFTQLTTMVPKGFGTTQVPVGVSRPLTALEGVLAEINLLYVSGNTTALSNELADKDAERDSYLTGLSWLCDAFAHHPNLQKRQAAVALQENLRLYGAAISDLTQQSLAAETTAITNLLNDWRTKTNLSAAAQLLGAGEWLDALDTANTSFQTKYMERTAAEAEASLPYTLEQKRAEAGTLYKELLDKIVAFYHTNDGAEPWLGLVGVVNAHIEKYSTLLAQRSGRATASKAKDAAKEIPQT